MDKPKTAMIKTYSELSKIKNFEKRYEYLRIGGKVGAETFGFDRYLNQIFYRSVEWKSIRNFVIIRDNGCDLGMEGYDIGSRIIIHHMNPLSKDDILGKSDLLLNPDYLICTQLSTHNAIHYGDSSLLSAMPIERSKNDTCPWKR